jgi:hypothetical protein
VKLARVDRQDGNFEKILEKLGFYSVFYGVYGQCGLNAGNIYPNVIDNI